MAKKGEDIYIRNIENGIRAIRLKTKTPDQVNVLDNLKRLQLVNVGMAGELQGKYENCLKEFKRREKQKHETA
jgi:hypothetical protein